MASAGILAGLDYLNSVTNNPHFTSYLSNFNVPHRVYIGLATLGFVTWLAHGRADD